MTDLSAKGTVYLNMTAMNIVIKSSLKNHSLHTSGGSSVSQNKLPQLILGYIYILKYLESNFIG